MTITQFKPNPGLNPSALPEWRKLTRAVNELERHRTILTGKIASQSRTAGATLQRIGTAVAEVPTGSTDTRAGNAPTGLGATVTGYYDGLTGNPSTQVVLTWTAPTTYADGSTYTASGYEIWRLLSGGEWQFISRVSGTTATLLRQPFAGSTYQYEVRAQSADNGLYGAFSSPVTVTPPTTLTPLSAPSTPVLTTSLGTVRATWDGLLGGVAAPAGFRGVYAVVSTDGGTTWVQKGQNLLFAGAQSVVGPYANGTVLQVRFRAVDALGVNSADSSTASITVTGVSGPDITANSITTNQIASGQITTALLSATAIDGMTITGATLQTIATASRGIKIVGQTLTGYDGSGSATFTLNGSTGAVTAVGLNATTATISGAITATSGSITGTMTVTGTLRAGTAGAARVDLTSAGLAGYNATNVQTFSFLTASGTLSATGGSFSGVTVSGAITATSGSITGTLTIATGGSVYSGSNTTGQASTTFSSTGLLYEMHGTMRVNLGSVADSDATSYGLAFDYAGNAKYAAIGLGNDNLLRMRGVGGIFLAGGNGAYTTATDQVNIGVASNGIILAAQTGDLSLSSSNVTISGGITTVNQRADFTLGTTSSTAFVKSIAITNYATGNASSNPPTGTSGMFVIIGSDGILRTLGSSPFFPQAYSATVTTRALNIGSSGQIGTASSSRRVKKNIQPLRWDSATVEKWLAIKPVSFEYRAERDNPGTHHGFIAEDVHDAGFKQMVYYDDAPDTKTPGRVDGFAYERMGVYDHIALGALYDELMSLRQRVAVLEGA